MTQDDAPRPDAPPAQEGDDSVHRPEGPPFGDQSEPAPDQPVPDGDDSVHRPADGGEAAPEPGAGLGHEVEQPDDEG